MAQKDELSIENFFESVVFPAEIAVLGSVLIYGVWLLVCKL